VSGVFELHPDFTIESQVSPIEKRFEVSKRSFSVLHGIKGKGRVVLGVAFLISPVSIFFLQPGAVAEHDPAQVGCGRSAVNSASESFAAEARKIPGMIEMSVGEKDIAYLGWRYRKRIPVFESVFL